jgi:hypothetical protein
MVLLLVLEDATLQERRVVILVAAAVATARGIGADGRWVYEARSVNCLPEFLGPN